jgi:hypothetical protein
VALIQGDIRSVLSGKKTKAVPLWELEFHLWEEFAGRPVPFGKAFTDLPDSNREKALMDSAEAILEVSDKLHFSAVTIPGGYWETSPGQPAFYWLPDRSRLRLAERLAASKPPQLLLVANVCGVLSMPDSPRFMEFCTRLLEDPDSVQAEAEEVLARGIEDASKLVDVGVEAVCSPSDIADNRGPFFNPEQMDRFILPCLRRWAAAVRDLGAFPILHTDGNVNSYLDAIAESGVSALQAVDPLAGMDIKKAQEKVGGRIALAGNVDCGLLVSGRPETVFAAAKSLLLSCKSGGKLILGASNAVQRHVPIANYLALTEAWEQYGRIE